MHVKECNMPPVPTLPVAGALCQHPSTTPATLLCDACPGSGHHDRSQMPIMCLHQAVCLLIPGAARAPSRTLFPSRCQKIVGGAKQRACPAVHTGSDAFYVSFPGGAVAVRQCQIDRDVVSLFSSPPSNASDVGIHFSFVDINS